MKIDLNAPAKSMKSASIAQLSSKMLNVVMQLVVTMVLARLLTPEQFGTVAVLTAFSGIFNILADAGVSTAIAQSHDLDESEYDRLLFLGLIIGLVLTAAFCLLSLGVAWFYEDAAYVPLGCFMSLAVLFNSLNMVPNGVLIKERKFNLIAAPCCLHAGRRRYCGPFGASRLWALRHRRQYSIDRPLCLGLEPQGCSSQAINR